MANSVITRWTVL